MNYGSQKLLPVAALVEVGSRRLGASAATQKQAMTPKVRVLELQARD